MRRVFSRFEEVAELWAGRRQSEARSGNGHVFFDDDVIYSYRGSFPIAALFDAPDGRTFCLYVEDTPSTSTAAHRSVAVAAARKAGRVAIGLPSIRDIVGMFSRPSRKVDAKTLAAMRKAIEASIEKRIAEAEDKADSSWIQSARLGEIATLLRRHAELAAAFGKTWPALASAEAYEARAEVAYGVTTSAAANKRKAEQAERKKLERRRIWEKNNPIPAARELELWRRGERLTLQHQPAEERGGANAHLIGPRTLRLRIRGSRLEADGWFSRPAAEFSRLFRAAVAAATGQPGQTTFYVNRDVLQVDPGGDIHIGGRTYYASRSIILFDELMTCAEHGAPRLHAKALAAIQAAAAAEEAEEADEEFDGEEPAAPGMAP